MFAPSSRLGFGCCNGRSGGLSFLVAAFWTPPHGSCGPDVRAAIGAYIACFCALALSGRFNTRPCRRLCLLGCGQGSHRCRGSPRVTLLDCELRCPLLALALPVRKSNDPTHHGDESVDCCVGGRVAGWDGRGKDTQAHYIIILHELALLGILLLMKALLSDGTRFILEIFHVLWC